MGLTENSPKKPLESVDIKIKELIEWNKKYPRAKLSPQNIDNLRFYAKTDEDFEKLLAEYNRMKKHYDYVRAGNTKGFLTKINAIKIKEGNIRGVFGYPTSTEILAKKYRIMPAKIDHIVSKYGSMERFLKAYSAGKLDDEDIFILKDNLRKNIPVNGNNPGLNLLWNKIFEKDLGNNFYINKKQLHFFDQDELLKSLDLLEEKEKEFIIKKFGIETGKTSSLDDSKDTLNVSRSRVGQLLPILLRKLNNICSANPAIFNTLLKTHDLTDEETKQMDNIAAKLFSSNCIFIPDTKYTLFPDSISKNTLKNLMNEYLDIDKAHNTQGQNIESLHLPTKVYNVLAKSGIRTVEELAKHSKEEIFYLEGMGITLFEQLCEILENNEIGKQFLQDKKWPEDDSIFILNLSNRSFRALHRNNITSVKQLADLNKFELLKLKSLGETSADEILDKFKVFCDENPDFRKEFVDAKPSGTTIDLLDLSTRAYNALINNQITSIEKLYMLNNSEILNINSIGESSAVEIIEKLKTFLQNNPDFSDDLSKSKLNKSLSISILDLSVRSFGALEKNGILTIADLEKVSYEELLGIKNIGVGSAREIVEKLEIFEHQISSQSEEEPSQLETLKEQKQEASSKEQALSSKVSSAKKLSDAYDQLLNPNVQNLDE